VEKNQNEKNNNKTPLNPQYIRIKWQLKGGKKVEKRWKKFFPPKTPFNPYKHWLKQDFESEMNP